ncbi:hypothetical protein ACQKMN_17050 [Ureibacillus composti]
MIDFQVEELIHRQVIINLTIRTLERERKHHDELKMKNAFNLWIDKQVKELQQLLREIKSELGKKGVKIQSEKIDGVFTVYTILDKGKDYERRYSNVALRNWCEEEVKRLLGIEHRITEDGMKLPGR